MVSNVGGALNEATAWRSFLLSLNDVPSTPLMPFLGTFSPIRVDFF
jgi:hypothetical protein